MPGVRLMIAITVTMSRAPCLAADLAGRPRPAATSWGPVASPEQAPRDDQPLDLVRAVEDLEDLGVAHHALHRVVPDHAVAAQRLHGVHGDLHGHVRGEELRHGAEVR